MCGATANGGLIFLALFFFISVEVAIILFILLYFTVTLTAFALVEPLKLK